MSISDSDVMRGLVDSYAQKLSCPVSEWAPVSRLCLEGYEFLSPGLELLENTILDSYYVVNGDSVHEVQVLLRHELPRIVATVDSSGVITVEGAFDSARYGAVANDGHGLFQLLMARKETDTYQRLLANGIVSDKIIHL